MAETKSWAFVDEDWPWLPGSRVHSLMTSSGQQAVLAGRMCRFLPVLISERFETSTEERPTGVERRCFLLERSL